MTKEQILGRLLMDGNINIDELNILNNNNDSIGKVVTRNDVTTKKEEESGNFDWLGKLKKNTYDENPNCVLYSYTFRD